MIRIDPNEGHPVLIVEFGAGGFLQREADRPSQLPIHRNGPPATFVLFRDAGLRVSLPTDQIVAADDRDGRVRVSFGGMEFVGLRDGLLTFKRVRELHPEEQLSPARSHTMTLDTSWVRTVQAGGKQLWPESRGSGF